MGAWSRRRSHTLSRSKLSGTDFMFAFACQCAMLQVASWPMKMKMKFVADAVAFAQRCGVEWGKRAEGVGRGVMSAKDHM